MITRNQKNRPNRRAVSAAQPATAAFAVPSLATPTAAGTTVPVTFNQSVVLQTTPTAGSPSGITVKSGVNTRAVIGATQSSPTTWALLLDGAVAVGVITLLVPQHDTTFRSQFGGEVLPGTFASA